jgi:hypothetical protein
MFAQMPALHSMHMILHCSWFSILQFSVFCLKQGAGAVRTASRKIAPLLLLLLSPD